MKIATVAMDTVWKDPKANILQTEKHVAKVMLLAPETQVILFPEISLMGLVEDKSNLELAETMDGYCVKEIKRIAKKYKVNLICGIIEKNPKGKPYNCAFVVSKDGRFVSSYRKNHLFTGSREPDFYSPGEELTMFELEGWKCGLSICFDIRFPRLFATYKNAGVELMFSGFNWVKGRNKPKIMEHAVKTRAHENQYFFAAIDRTGSDPDTSYYGTSVITNPYAEDFSTKKGIYAFADLDKNEMYELRKRLPLEGSFKEKYKISK